jgi:hypothetical protein
MTSRPKPISDSGTPQPRSQRLVVLSWHHWLVISLTLFVLLVASALAVHFFLDEFLWEHLLAARLEERYGFKGGRVPVAREDGGTYEVYILVDVINGGPLHRAGFESGDVPSGGFHSQSVAFLRSLDLSCLYPDRKFSVYKLGPQGIDRDAWRQLALPCVE